MGALYDTSQRLMREVEERYPDPIQLLRAKGQIAQSAGFLVSLISPGDPDDPAKLAGLRTAAAELGIEL